MHCLHFVTFLYGCFYFRISVFPWLVYAKREVSFVHLVKGGSTLTLICSCKTPPTVCTNVTSDGRFGIRTLKVKKMSTLDNSFKYHSSEAYLMTVYVCIFRARVESSLI